MIHAPKYFLDITSLGCHKTLGVELLIVCPAKAMRASSADLQQQKALEVCKLKQNTHAVHLQYGHPQDTYRLLSAETLELFTGNSRMTGIWSPFTAAEAHIYICPIDCNT